MSEFVPALFGPLCLALEYDSSHIEKHRGTAMMSRPTLRYRGALFLKWNNRAEGHFDLWAGRARSTTGKQLVIILSLDSRFDANVPHGRSSTGR